MKEFEGRTIQPPITYQEWLECFEILKSSSSGATHVIEAIKEGCFDGEGRIVQAYQDQLITTINVMLDNRVQRFVKEVNQCIEFNELHDLVPLFRALKREVRNCMFYNELEFIEPMKREEITYSFKRQVNDFWNEAIWHLKEESIEKSNDDLDDALFLVNRIRLFLETDG